MKKLFTVPLLILLFLHTYAFSQVDETSNIPGLIDIQTIAFDSLEVQWGRMEMQLQKLGDINFELKDSLVNLSDITVKLKNDLKQSRNLLNDAKKEAESVAEYNTVLKGDIDKLKYELEQKSKELKKSECKNKLYGGISIVAIFASILTVVVMH